jgi:hypothetical protein
LELLAKQAELNAALDLDKGEQQAAMEEAGDLEGVDAGAPAPGAVSSCGDERPAPGREWGADRTARLAPRRRVYKPRAPRPGM